MITAKQARDNVESYLKNGYDIIYNKICEKIKITSSEGRASIDVYYYKYSFFGLFRDAIFEDLKSAGFNLKFNKNDGENYVTISW